MFEEGTTWWRVPQFSSKYLILENYQSQEEFAFEFGIDIRSVSRYINNGINKINIVQELAAFFQVDFMPFFEDDSCDAESKRKSNAG